MTLLVLLCFTTGCGRFWQSEDRLSGVEQKVELLTECAEETTAANERQDANIVELRGEFYGQRTLTNDAISQLREAQLTEEEKKELFDGLEKHRLAQAAQANGATTLLQPPVATYTPPPPSPVPVPVQAPLTAYVYQPPQQQQQQPRVEKWWCCQHRCWHYRYR